MKILLLETRLGLLLGRGDLVPGIAVGGLPLRIRRHQGPELGFVGALGIHHAFVLKALFASIVGFQRILQAENLFRGAAVGLRTGGRVLLQRIDAAVKNLQNGGLVQIALGFELRQRVRPLRGSGIAGDEHQLAIGRALRIPLEIVLALDGPAVLIHAEQREIQVVAGIREVVGIAAKERDLLLRREDDPHIRVFLVAIQPVFPALIERDHVGAEAGLFQAFALDGGDRVLALGEFLLRVARSLQGVLYAGRHVLHGDQDVHFQIGRLDFFFGRARVETRFDVVMFGRRILLQLAQRDVVVRQQQPGGADERSRSAVVQPHAGKPDMVEPLLGDREVVFVLNQPGGRIVEGPHPFLGLKWGMKNGEGKNRPAREQNRSLHKHHGNAR